MKTKTLTFHSAHNYGAVLQAFALQKVLQNNSFENEIINYNNPYVVNQYNPLKFEGLSLKQRFRKLVKFSLYGRKLLKRYNSFNSFITNDLILSKELHNVAEIADYLEEDDVLITGSDQVWNYDILNELSDIYFLNFSNNKKISYAASVGNSILDSQLLNEYREKISKIDCVSVREKTTALELEKIIKNKSIYEVLDPTLLLNKNEWLKYSSKSVTNINQKYILAYTMDSNQEYVNIVNYLSNITGLKVIYLDYHNIGFKNVLKSAFTYGPFEFINLINNAQYIVTNSFHGTAFSINLNKNFWVIPHKTKGSRMIDLVHKVGLSDRILYTLDDFKKVSYSKQIDFTKCNKILDRERRESINWLIDSINTDKNYE